MHSCALEIKFLAAFNFFCDSSAHVPPGLTKLHVKIALSTPGFGPIYRLYAGYSFLGNRTCKNRVHFNVLGAEWLGCGLSSS